MGFWHTGYGEFHEETGLGDFKYESSPPRYSCGQCEQVFGSRDELRNHRFESHPLYKPILLLQDIELGSHPHRITRMLKVDDVCIKSCTLAVLNGKKIPPKSLPKKLAAISSDVCQLVLTNGEISTEFEIHFCIASSEHVVGVENEFQELATRRQLNIHQVEKFVEATSSFQSAIGYCDGICAYLYGVLAKERHPDSSLPYDQYTSKFTTAAEKLAAYDRPWARTIRSVIEFHFNHFDHVAQLSEKSRVGQAAIRYQRWLTPFSSPSPTTTVLQEAIKKPDGVITDCETEQVLKWSIKPVHELIDETNDIEDFLASNITDLDRGKLRVLLSEVYFFAGNTQHAIQHVKALRNVQPWATWADRQISQHFED